MSEDDVEKEVGGGTRWESGERKWKTKVGEKVGKGRRRGEKRIRSGRGEIEMGKRR